MSTFEQRRTAMEKLALSLRLVMTLLDAAAAYASDAGCACCKDKCECKYCQK